MRTSHLAVFALGVFSLMFASPASAAMKRPYAPFDGNNYIVVPYHTFTVRNFRCLRIGHDGQCVRTGEELISRKTVRRVEARTFLLPDPTSVSPFFRDERHRTLLPRERCVPERDRMGRVIRTHCVPFGELTSVDVTPSR